MSRLYAEVLSRKALPLLHASPVSYTYRMLVDAIIIKGDGSCPLEQIVDNTATADNVELLLRQHFDEVKAQKEKQ